MAKLIACTQEVREEAKQDPEKARSMCQELEDGHILFFPQIPFAFPQEDREFLIHQKQMENASRKNIAYKPHRDVISNLASTDLTKREKETCLQIMRRYTYGVEEFLGSFLSPYKSRWKLDYASFRPMQEKGRNLRKRARNDLLHIDAFPSRPVHGARILRFFTNINPDEARKWITAHTFQELLQIFSKEELLQSLRKRMSPKKRFLRSWKKCLKALGLPITVRSSYDQFMLDFHHFLKENEEYQKNCPKHYWDFPPGSCWLVFPDQRTHAVLEGQYALELTLLVNHQALLNPEQSPVGLLEQFSKQTMIERSYAHFA